MRIEDINESIIGRRVKGVENGYEVTGTIVGIREDEHLIYVKIKLDETLHCWSGDFDCNEWDEDEYESWGRKWDGFGNIELTHFID